MTEKQLVAIIKKKQVTYLRKRNMKDREIQQLITRFSGTRENQQKAIFSTLFIAGNRLQTLFDSHIPEISLKQFMLLSIVRQSPEQLTFTQLGDMLGCSRQNIKKLADVLEKKGFITIRQSPSAARAMYLCPAEKAEEYFQKEFSVYQEELRYLFERYTDEEVQQLFRLMMKLYDGIENLQDKVMDKIEDNTRDKSAGKEMERK